MCPYRVYLWRLISVYRHYIGIIVTFSSCKDVVSWGSSLSSLACHTQGTANNPFPHIHLSPHKHVQTSQDWFMYLPLSCTYLYIWPTSLFLLLLTRAFTCNARPEKSQVRRHIKNITSQVRHHIKNITFVSVSFVRLCPYCKRMLLRAHVSMCSWTVLLVFSSEK